MVMPQFQMQIYIIEGLYNRSSQMQVFTKTRGLFLKYIILLLFPLSPSQEFGFSLHAEGNGHFIGAVDTDGIAERAGLVSLLFCCLFFLQNF